MHFTFVNNTYFQDIDARVSSWALTLDMAMVMLGRESGASKQAKLVVLSAEFGHFTLAIWKFSFVVGFFPPLSPPTFSQISSSGIKPECHVRLPNLQ